MVGVLVGEDDADDIAEVEQRVGERSRVDDEALSGLVDGERGMVVLGDSHTLESTVGGPRQQAIDRPAAICSDAGLMA